MSEFMPTNAPIAVLAFLGTLLLLFVCALLFLVGLLRKSRIVLRIAATTAAIVLAGYVAILLGFSLFSSEVSLPMGAWKYFCEIDCHIANAVTHVRVAPKVGPDSELVSSRGQLVVVEVTTWFDSSTIGPHRGNGPLTPNARSLTVVDGTGRSYSESARTGEVLSALRLQSTPLRTPLRPGEAYVSYFVFEVPSFASNLGLQLTAADSEDRLLWGHENSPLHKKITFSLDVSPGFTTSKSL